MGILGKCLTKLGKIINRLGQKTKPRSGNISFFFGSHSKHVVVTEKDMFQ